MTRDNQSYNIKVNFKTSDERELRYIVNRKLAGIINLTENSGRVRL